MTKPTVYEVNACLYGYQELEGKPATMEYLPTARSRKWRASFFVKSYSEYAYQTAMEALRRNDFYTFRFVSG